MTDYLPREITRQIREALRIMPVVVLTGMRQTGKTTLLRREPLLAERDYVTLDDFAALAAARENPEGLLRGSRPLAIDEAQRAPGLLLAVKRWVDAARRPGMIVLSGSANFSLLEGVSESLAGRAVYLPVLPFSRRELLGQTTHTPLLIRLMAGEAPQNLEAGTAISEDEVLTGGLPPAALSPVAGRDTWFLGFEQTYLERDLRDLAAVADLISFRNLMQLCCLRTAQVLNQSELARDAKLPVTTVARYLNLLETSFVIRRLPPYLSSRTSRLIKSPKLLVGDSGLAAHLAGVDDIGPASNEPLRGALFETYVAQNLLATLAAWKPQAELAYWHVQGRHEVDFVIHWGRRCLAIEVKAASQFSDRDLASLRAFQSTTSGVVAAVLAYNGARAVTLGPRLYAVPLSLLLD